MYIEHYPLTNTRSSHRRCSVRKGVLRNFVKFAGKHLCQSLFINKVAGPAEPSPGIVFIDNTSSFHEMLQVDHSFDVHHRNIQSLGIELYKIKKNLSNEVMSSVFPPRLIKYNLQTQSDLLRIL